MCPMDIGVASILALHSVNKNVVIINMHLITVTVKEICLDVVNK